MKIKKEIKEILTKKLEYRFKTSPIGVELINKINSDEASTNDVQLLVGKLEYKFKNSSAGKSLIKELKNL